MIRLGRLSDRCAGHVGWTFTWIVTAVGGTHACLRKVEASAIYDEIQRERVTTLCAAPTVLIAIGPVLGHREVDESGIARHAAELR